MMVTELYRERGDGAKLYRTYSDAGLMIRQEQTSAANYPSSSTYTYVEE